MRVCMFNARAAAAPTELSLFTVHSTHKREAIITELGCFFFSFFFDVGNAC